MAEPNSESPIYKLLDLTVDTRAETVSRDGVEIDLRLLSYRVLLKLVEQAPQWVSTQTLLDSVWTGTVVNEQTVIQRINLLRKSLDDRSADGRYIRTSRERGYRLVPEVQVLKGRRPRPVRQWISRKMKRRLVMAAGVAVAFGLIWITAPDRTPPEAEPPAQRSTKPFDPADQLAQANPGLHQIYLQALEFIQMDEPHHLAAATRLLERVIEAAPDNPAAFAAAAYAYADWSSDWGGGVEQVGKARRYAENAIRIDPAQSAAYLALGILEMEDGSFDESAAYLAEARRTSPDGGEAPRRMAKLAYRRGEPEQALSILQGAGTLSPTDQVMAALYQWELGLHPAARETWQDLAAERPQWWLPQFYLSLDEIITGRLESAMARMQEMLDFYPACQSCMHRIATIAVRQGDRPLARFYLEQALQSSVSDNYMRVSLALEELLDGHPIQARALFSEASAIARQALEDGSQSWVHPWILAGLAAVEGDEVWAQRWLRRAVAAGRTRIEWDRNEPMFATVRDRPWFQEILLDMEKKRSDQLSRARRLGNVP